MPEDAGQLSLSFEAWSPAVEIRPSTRRRKTVAAHWEGDTIVVSVPQRLSRRQRQEHADALVAQLLEQRRATHPSDEELLARALALLAEHLPEVPPPAAVAWAAREGSRWASCSLGDRTIRVSESLRGVPPWVLDAVLVHELSHLVQPRHDAAFRALAGRHPRSADAEVFLAGYQLGLERSRA